MSCCGWRGQKNVHQPWPLAPLVRLVSGVVNGCWGGGQKNVHQPWALTLNQSVDAASRHLATGTREDRRVIDDWPLAL